MPFLLQGEKVNADLIWCNFNYLCDEMPIVYNHVTTGRGGDFYVLKVLILLLLRKTLITRLSSEESAFVVE